MIPKSLVSVPISGNPRSDQRTQVVALWLVWEPTPITHQQDLHPLVVLEILKQLRGDKEVSMRKRVRHKHPLSASLRTVQNSCYK